MKTPRNDEAARSDGGATSAAPEGSGDLRGIAARAAAVCGVVALFLAGALVLALYPTIPLSLFVAVLGASLLHGAATPLRTRLAMPRAAAVLLVTALGLALAVGAGWLGGPHIVDQGAALLERIPRALNDLEGWLEQRGWGEFLLSTTSGDWDAERLTTVLGRAWKPVAGVFATALTAVSGAAVLATIAVFLALDPELYERGLLHLVRPERRGHYRCVLRAMSQALRWWLVGRLGSMTVVGVLTGLGFWLTGVPLPAVLGVLAGVLSFIPYLGPLLAAVPAVLVALAESPHLVLWVLAVSGGVQVLEGNLITPLIQARTVSLAPAILITAQLLLGALFGLLGVLVATPLAVVVIVAVQTLWVRDVLGDPISLMGDHHGRFEADEDAPERTTAGRGEAGRC